MVVLSKICSLTNFLPKFLIIVSDVKRVEPFFLFLTNFFFFFFATVDLNFVNIWKLHLFPIQGNYICTFWCFFCHRLLAASRIEDYNEDHIMIKHPWFCVSEYQWTQIELVYTVYMKDYFEKKSKRKNSQGPPI